MLCDRCVFDRKMVTIKDPYLIKHRCNSCEGIYVEKAQFKKLVKEISGSDLNLFPEPEKDDIHPTIHCPECSSVEMAKKTISEFSETIFDYCPECGGVFLDKNEFTEMNLSAKETMPINPEHLGVFNEHVTEESIAEGFCHGVSSNGTDTCDSYYFIRFSICFKENLGLGLNMFAEKWTDKLAKIIGLSRKQDIQIGDKKIDSQFIIQGYYKEDIVLLLTDSKVRKSIYDLNIKELNKPNKSGAIGNFRISDSKVTYSEGPYGHPIKFEKTGNPEKAKTKLMNVVEAVENYYTSGASTTSKRKF